MNVKSMGLGDCQKCGSPIMGAINQPGIAGVCFACQQDALPKTGQSIVITEETGDLNASKPGAVPGGKVKAVFVQHTVGESSPVVKNPEAVRKQIAEKAVAKGAISMEDPQSDTFTVHLSVAVDELCEGNILLILLKKAYDGLDDLPSGTIKTAKRIIRVQEKIEATIASLSKGEKK